MTNTMNKIKTLITRTSAAAMLLLTLVAPPSVLAENLEELFTDSGNTNPVSHLVLIKYVVDGESKSGNGVIVQMNEKSYILTNQHHLLGSDRMSFTNVEGERLQPIKVELSTNRDLARLALKNRTSGLRCSTNVKMNMPITLFSGSKEAGHDSEDGQIIGVGGKKIEISMAFDESCNGAPALDENQQVVGIASYSSESSDHTMKIGTRFEEATRHFCYRIGPGGWKSVNWRVYNRKFGKKYQKHKSFADEIITTLKASEQSGLPKSRANELATACRTHCTQIQLLTEQKDITGFLLNELQDLQEYFEYFAKAFLDYANDVD